jgi:hypothetical protein
MANVLEEVEMVRTFVDSAEQIPGEAVAPRIDP